MQMAFWSLEIILSCMNNYERTHLLSMPALTIGVFFANSMFVSLTYKWDYQGCYIPKYKELATSYTLAADMSYTILVFQISFDNRYVGTTKL